MSANDEFAKWLKAQRMSSHVTICRLSAITGISKSYISDIENGKAQNISLNKASILSDTLGFQLWEVLRLLD